ncbi:MAG: DUF1015 domain-containing protein [Pirellulales bacterium]|nr:DUF1015 domain-containing protein [Pirellulales bacterium]
MVNVSAFRGIRYDLAQVGSLSDVIAPPYDVIDPNFQESLYKQHPANVIRLILNRQEPGDESGDERYERAARYLRQWQREGVFFTENESALYVYHQQFDYAGQTFVRRGFMGRLQLEPFGEGQVYPHEETHSAAKADRLKLFNATKCNLSQIFGIYPDESNDAQQLLESAIVGVTPLEATDHLGVLHRLWPVTDVKVIAEVSSAMADLPMYVADGHHRYETGCNYRQQMMEQEQIGPDHPANFVLTMCVSMNDPGMIVLPTHRLLRGISPVSVDQLTSSSSDYFELTTGPTGADSAAEVWEEIEVEDQQGTIGLFCAADDQWVLARVNEAGAARLQEIASDQSSDWCGLGVSILHRLILDDLLGLTDLPKPDYVHLVGEVVDGLAAGDEDGAPYGLAALVMPATLDHIRQISQNGERMPAKSTYFYPKLLSGLVINPISQ